MKITFAFITVVIVWMYCLLSVSSSGTDERTGRRLLQLESRREPKMKGHLMVTTILNRPFVMRKEQTNRSPDDKFEGYVVDLLESLRTQLNFTYQLHVVKDGFYGNQNSAGEWTGMVGEILNGDADIAIADLTTTALRQSVIDFTTPFMTSGIGILMKKPSVPSLKKLFLMPFDSDVWISGIVAFSVISALLFVMSRVNSSEWVNIPSSSGSYNRENNLKFCNSLFFALGSLTQQGSRVAPRAVATRILAATWWIFCFFFVACYISNLTAILVHQLEKSAHGPAIQSIEDLERQTDVKYGTIRGGSTRAFFANSQIGLYQRMFAFMESVTPSPYVKNYEEGIKRVKDGDFAMFMESQSIEYMTERDCDLTQVGGLLDYRGYGIGMAKDSGMLNDFSSAILRLQEKGTLLALRTKWWKLEEGTCKAQPKTTGPRGALTMESISGIFILLILGSILALLVGVVELFWKAKQSSKEGGSLGDEVIRELKFGLCGGSHKTSRQGDGLTLQQ